MLVCTERERHYLTQLPATGDVLFGNSQRGSGVLAACKKAETSIKAMFVDTSESANSALGRFEVVTANTDIGANKNGNNIFMTILYQF